MVSFTCNHCQDVVKKPKVQNHYNTCGSHSFTCVDCMQVFDLDTIKAHTSCVTEEDKYQGKWKQKLSSNGNNISGGGEAPRGIERPPRAPMNDLSSSDDSDDDWAAAGKKTKAAAPAKAKSAVAAPSRRKNPRPGVSPSSDDDDDEGHHHHARSTATSTAAPPAKKAKTTRSASATPQARPTAAAAAAAKSPKSASLGPAQRGTAAAKEEGEAQHPGKKDTPLLLPRSTVSTECMVPSFVLGTSEEVAEIVRDVLAEQGVASMRSKDLSLALVDRYAKRIAKALRHAVDTAVELQTLKVDAKGNVALA